MIRTLRLFIAIELPETVARHLDWIVVRLRQQGIQTVRWLRPEGIHLTLKFLGDTPAGRMQSVVEAMSAARVGIAPFALQVAGIGAFPSLRAPRVIWVGVQGDVEPLLRLQRGLEEALEARGFQRELRPFSPHLTLARVREGLAPLELARLAKAVEALRGLEPEDMPVAALSLVESQLTPEGAIYHARAEVRLEGGLASSSDRDILPKV